MTRINFILIFLLTIGLNAQNLSDDTIASVQIEGLTSEIITDSIYVDLDNKKTLKEEKSRIVKKADAFFDIMWYAKAAKYYDLAIEQSKGKPSKYLLARAGDSHYFNSNIKQAYKWYDLLQKDYENDISDNTLFNYVHTLKGTGRKRRAKRIIDLLNEKTEQELMADVPAVSDSLAEDSKFDLKNLEINSKYSDFSPMYYGKDKLLYASAKDTSFINARKYKWDNQPYLNLYTANVDSTKNDVYGTNSFSKNINTKLHEASACFSPDKKTIYFTRNNYRKKKKIKRDEKGINHLKLYISKKVNDEWTEAVELPFNSDSYSTGHPAITTDGKRLFFVSDMPGGYGNTDVYVVDIEEDGTFSEPRNLGMAVNSPNKEMFPFITENTLYFSSDRLAGRGGLDIYKSSFSAEGFDKAENLGAPFNSERDDFSIIIDEETEKGYFASSRAGGKGRDDIYYFAPASEEIPNLNEISGYVVDIITGDSLPNATVSIYDADKLLVEEIKTDANGVFRFNNLTSSANYTLLTILDGYSEETTPVATKSNEVVDLVLPISRLDELIAAENEDAELPNLNEISGYIIDVAVGDYLPNAIVSLYDDEHNLVEKVSADENGVFRFKNLKSNTDYTVETSLDGYVEETTPVSTVSNELVNLIVQIEPIPVAEELPNLNEISGYIIDSVTSDYLPNAMVSLYDGEHNLVEKVSADENGVFRFKNLKSNTDYTVKTSLDDYVEETTPVSTVSNKLVGIIVQIKPIPVEDELPNLNEISGYIIDSVAGDYLPNAIVSLFDDEHNLVEKVSADENGVFRFKNLKSNTDYTVETSLDGYIEQTTPVSTVSNELVDLIVQVEPIQEIVIVEKGIKKLKTEMIFFDFDRFNIRQDAANELNKLVEIMIENPDMVIKIESHTDAIGSTTYNKQLSGKRANSTKEYLISQGVEAYRIESAVGYGEERLLNACNDGVKCSKEKHAENRRSEFIVVNM